MFFSQVPEESCVLISPYFASAGTYVWTLAGVAVTVSYSVTNQEPRARFLLAIYKTRKRGHFVPRITTKFILRSVARNTYFRLSYLRRGNSAGYDAACFSY